MTKKKPRILIWSDFVAPTGFGNVAKNLYETLHKTYEVSIVGINYYGNRRYDTLKYFVYSVTRDDMLGMHRLFEVAKQEKPDLIFLFQDVFNIAEIIDKLAEENPSAKIVTYFPIDGGPFSKAWENVLQKSHAIITYSDWAIRTIKDTFPKFKKKIFKLYHGVNTEDFYLLKEEENAKARQQVGWDKKFVVGNINRFQPRKAIPLTLRAFSMFAKSYKKCTNCGNKMPAHLTRCDLNNCDPSYLQSQGTSKDDVYLYLHMMPRELSMGPSRTNLLQNHLINAGIIEKDYSKIIGINARNIYNHEVSEKDLNIIYNSMNVNISTTLGEGCGLSLLESQAAGTPSIAPNNSAIPEVLNGTGALVTNNAMYSHPNDNAHVRPHVDPFEVTLMLEQYYKRWNNNGRDKIIDQDCINNIQNNFLWPDKREYLEKIFHEVLFGNINSIK